MAKYKITMNNTEKYFEVLDELQKRNNLIMASIIKNAELVEVGDMFWVRDTLIEDFGYILWKDFIIKKYE